VGPDGKATQLTRPEDQVDDAAAGPDDTFLLVCRKDAPRGKILRVPRSEPKFAAAVTVRPQDDGVLCDWAVAGRRVFAVSRRAGSGRLRVFAVSGREEAEVPVPPFTAVEELTPLPGGALLFRRTGYLEPPAWFRYDPETRRLKKVGLAADANAEA